MVVAWSATPDAGGQTLFHGWLEGGIFVGLREGTRANKW